ncbi:MAG: hypothetical protein IKS22_00295 [Bacteroidales bacterium]|nr:hypothetical protein [Bacteroidales bacterium]
MDITEADIWKNTGNDPHACSSKEHGTINETIPGKPCCCRGFFFPPECGESPHSAGKGILHHRNEEILVTEFLDELKILMD